MMTKNQASAMLNEITDLMRESYPNFSSNMSVRRFIKEDGQVSFKMEMTDKTVSEVIETPETHQAFIKNGVLYGALGLKFTSHGKDFIVEGCKNRRQKYPVLARDQESGKLFKFTASMINAKIRG